MPNFLSNEWLRALDRAATAGSRALLADSNGCDLVLQLVVTDSAGGELAYTIEVKDAEVVVRPGRASDPTLSFTTDRRTARAISCGDESAQTAFIQGRLRLGGDVRALVENANVLTRLDQLFAPVRDATTY